MEGGEWEKAEEKEKTLKKKPSLAQLRFKGRRQATGMKVPAYRGQLTSTFSTTCFPKEQTLVEQVTVIFSELSYWLVTP